MGKYLMAYVISGTVGILAISQIGLAQTLPFPAIVDGSGGSIGRDILRKAAKIVADKTPDPYAVQFRNIRRSKNGAPIICGQFNAKNRFGSYNGFLDFLYYLDGNSSFETIDQNSIGEDTLEEIEKKIKILEYNLKLLKIITSSCEEPIE